MVATSKRRSKQPTTKRQRKRQRLASALTPVTSVTVTQVTQQPEIFTVRTSSVAKERNQISEPVVVFDSQSVLLRGRSLPLSIADGWNVQDGPPSTASLTGSFDDCCWSARYDSEESCLSLRMLEVKATKRLDGHVQRSQDIEHDRVHDAHEECRPRVRSYLVGVSSLVVLIVIFCLFGSGIDWSTSLTGVINQVLQYRPKIERDSICVSGGGFSGFWFIIGRLQSIPDPMNKNYYCFSAGCLGLVASLRGIAMDDVHSSAIALQTKWKTGEISRHEVLTSFVDSLVYSKDALVEQNLPFLDRLNILTTVADGRFGLKTSTRTPTSADSLRTLLIQSAWIPFVVGNELFHQSHMDGAFHLVGHPRCEHSIGLPANIEVLTNILNVNLSADKVKKFWKLGIERGL